MPWRSIEWENLFSDSAAHRSEFCSFRRASQRWIFGIVVSVQQERSTLRMLSIRMKFDAISFYLRSMYRCHSSQTLRTLNLRIYPNDDEVMKQFRRGLTIVMVSDDLFILLIFLMRWPLLEWSGSIWEFMGIGTGWRSLRRMSNIQWWTRRWRRGTIFWRISHPGWFRIIWLRKPPPPSNPDSSLTETNTE